VLGGLGRLLRAWLFVAMHRNDRIGFWYTPAEVARLAQPLGLECAILGCVLYPYRFTAVLSRPSA
jgi:hypothetical protein